MDQKKQENSDNIVISPLAKDLTYGEKKYHSIFNIGINFGLNLVTSAIFTTWMSHARTPIKLPFMKEKIAPYMLQQNWAEKINKLPVMRVFGDKSISVAKTMAGILSLTTAGHFIMIPSVWLGSKFKSQLVERWDRQHYGDEAMEDPSLKLRHAMVAAEERTTLFGAIFGRIGSVVATQVTGYTVGNATNIPSMLGKKFKLFGWFKNLKGIDYYTELMGSKVGSVLTESQPGMTKKINDYFREKRNFGWSNVQMDAHRAELTGVPYGTTTAHGYGGGIPEHLGRNFVADIMYTIVTACSIAPAINFLKRYIPGITSKPKISAEHQRILDEAKEFNARPAQPAVIRDAAPESDIPGLAKVDAPNDNFNSVNDNGHAPRTKVSGTKDHEAPAMKQALNAVHAG